MWMGLYNVTFSLQETLAFLSGKLKHFMASSQSFVTFQGSELCPRARGPILVYLVGTL